MDTSTLFFILAGVLIAILIGYSLWSSRREKSRVFSNTFATRPVSTPLGSQSPSDIPETLNSEGFSHQAPLEAETEEQLQAQQQEIDKQVRKINVKLSDQPDVSIAQPQTNIFTAQPVQQVETQPDYQTQYPEESNIQITQENEVETAPENTETNLITLYVVAPEGRYFNGLNVMQQLEALGLQYGEYHIFHRHIDNPGSPVLFSVANMMQPGIFDLANIENFATVGLVFFMHLPSPSNDLANLRIMISTVDSFAQALGGFVLNDQQQLFDERSRQEYVQRLRNH